MSKEMQDSALPCLHPSSTICKWRSQEIDSIVTLNGGSHIESSLRRWGICERHGPKQYDFGAYMELFKKARKHGLKVQAVMSFHAGGGNVGDGSCDIPLPDWVIKVRLICRCLLRWLSALSLCRTATI